MKSMKKTLGIILAAVMLFAVCSMSVSAAVPEGNAIALGIKVKDGQVIEKGQPVTFVVTLEETADFYAANGGLNVGEFEIAYDSSVFEPIADLSTNTTLASQKISVAGYSVAGGVDTGNSSVSAGGAGVDAKNNWDSVLHITLVENGSAALDARYIDCSKGAVDTFEFQLKVKEDAADGTYKIGHNKTGYDGFVSYVISGNELAPSTGWYVFMEDVIGCSPIYDFGTCDVTVGAGGSTEPEQPTVKVNNLETQVQWANQDAGLMNLGFRGQIAEGYDATADKDGTKGPNGGDNLTKLTEVGFYLNGTKYSAYTIYDFVNGGYFYRVVVGNVSYDSETVFSAQAYVMIDGQEYKADASFETTGKAQYERAKDSMGAK